MSNEDILNHPWSVFDAKKPKKLENCEENIAKFIKKVLTNHIVSCIGSMEIFTLIRRV